MAATVLVQAFLRKVSIQLMDNSPQFKRWSSAELVGWAQDGQLTLGKFMPWAFARHDAIKLKAGTRQTIDTIAQADNIPGDGSSARLMHGNFVQSIDMNMGTDGATEGRAIRLVDREVLDATDPLWHLAKNADVEVRQYAYDPRLPKVFWVCPGVAATATVWVMANLLIDPVALDTTVNYSTTGAAILLSLDDQYSDELLNYVLARAHMKDAENDQALALVAAHSKLFVDSLNAIVKARTGVNPNLKSLPLNAAVPAAAS